MRYFSTILYLFIVFQHNFFAQNLKIRGNYVANYKGIMRLGENNTKEENFVFIFNSNTSYYVSDTNYQNENSGDFGLGSYFPERYIFYNNKFNVSGKYVEASISYDEDVSFKWEIKKEKKFINGIHCQLATTKKYGRIWNAYFAKEYPFSLGPVKFNGLPGLIFEVSDSEGQYKFTLENLKKQDIEVKVNLDRYKKLSKIDYLKARENSEFSINSFPGLPAQESREFEKKLQRLKQMNNNPIEIKPFD